MFSRAVDKESVDVRITLTLDDSSGLSQSINTTRVGTTDQWVSEAVTVPEDAPFTIDVVWSAIGVDGVRVDYARQLRSFNGINSNEVLDFTTVPYTFDEFNEDGGSANNYDELVAGTPPTGPPEPQGLPQPVQASIELVPDKTFRISWLRTTNVLYYRVLENADGVSGFVAISGDLDTATRSYDHRVALYQRVNAQYLVQACNDAGCADSATLLPTATLSAAVGYIKASNTDTGDNFGESISLSDDGTTLAVGAFSENSSASGINGSQSDNSSADSGAVYVYVRSNGAWLQQAYIKASNTDAGDFFGRTVSLSADGNTMAVGATREDSSATGINGNQNDNSSAEAGAVYVFTRSDGAWAQQAYIKPSNTGAGDIFGLSVSLSADGKTLAVVAFNEDSSATGVNGNQNDNSSADSGAAYVFVQSGGAWQQQAYIKASNTGAGDNFGRAGSLSADGNTLAVGAFNEDSSAVGINGNQADNLIIDAGAVYVFVRSNGSWTQQAYIKASNTGVENYFGLAVSLSVDGNTLAVGATGDDSAATGVNGDQNNSSSSSSGAVYVFDRGNGTWRQQAYIKASNTSAGADFGRAVSLSSDGQYAGCRGPQRGQRCYWTKRKSK